MAYLGLKQPSRAPIRFCSSYRCIASFSMSLATGKNTKFTRTLTKLSTFHFYILLAFSLWLIPNSYKASPEEIEGNDYRFSSERLENLRLNQQAVFLNFTADWCITCKVNEAIALNRESVKKILADKNIVYLKADWTRKDPEIASMLANYGRTGVPLYILFPPQGEPIILPELLTEDLLLDFINKIN